MELLPPERYQPKAEAAFKALEGRLAPLLSGARIEHVGASSIPGAVSKGDLDVCVIVGKDRFAAALDRLLALGYQVKAGTLRTQQLCMLVPAAPGDDHAVQLVEAGSKFEFFVSFRDALRRDPDAVARYNEVKRRAAGHSEERYREAKSAFIAQILKQEGLPCPSNSRKTPKSV